MDNYNDKKSFDFFMLPLLVQYKILREYLSTIFKLTRLQRVPELYKMLEDRAIWMDPSDNFVKFIRLAATLQPGSFYLPRGGPRGAKWWKDGFYLEVDDEKNTLRFTHFSLRDTFCAAKTICSGKKFISRNEPISTVGTFLEEFLENYIPCQETDVVSCRDWSLGWFFVWKGDSVYWSDGKRYQLTGGFDSLRLPVSDGRSVVMSPDGDLSAEYVCWDGGKWRKSAVCLSDKLEKLSLKDLLLTNDGKNIMDFKSRFSIEFRIVESEKRVEVGMEALFGRVKKLFPRWEFAQNFSPLNE